MSIFRDIGGEISTYLSGESARSATEALGVSEKRILSEIRKMNPSFSVRDMLLKTLDEERDKRDLQKTLAWKLYKLGLTMFEYRMNFQDPGDTHVWIHVLDEYIPELRKIFPLVKKVGSMTSITSWIEVDPGKVPGSINDILRDLDRIKYYEKGTYGNVYVHTMISIEFKAIGVIQGIKFEPSR